MRAQLYLRQEDLTGAGGGTSAPRIDVDLPGCTRCERVPIEERNGPGIEQEAPVFSRNLHGDNRQPIAALDRNFVFPVAVCARTDPRKQATRRTRTVTRDVGFTEPPVQTIG